MFGQVQKIIGNISSSAGYPAKLFPMEVQVAFYRHNPTTRTSLTTAAFGSLLLVVAVPPGDGHEGNCSWVVAHLLDEAR